jgi:carboxypeptidase C (cathepsin A)
MAGFMQEISPLIIKPLGSRVELNEHAWNKRAGLVTFEAPLGVGFSTTTKEDAIINEDTVVKDLLHATDSFLSRHSNLLNNQLFIAGSGYGASLAVKLARALIDQNNDEARLFPRVINIAGLLLGNPCIYPG